MTYHIIVGLCLLFSRLGFLLGSVRSSSSFCHWCSGNNECIRVSKELLGLERVGVCQSN